MNNYFKKRKSLKSLAGFTITELLVTLAIVTVVMTVILFNYRTFTDNLAISSAAQEISIAIRQAQSYGINVKEAKVGGGQFAGYGIYFNPTDVTTNTSYVLFADQPLPGLFVGNKKYDEGSGCGSLTTECIEKFNLRNGVILSSLNSSTCNPINAVRSLSITFLRPNPDADINLVNNGGNIMCASQKNSQIGITSLNGKTLIISVDSTGKVSIE